MAREVDAVARERAHGQWLVNYLRDQDAPHDAAATEKAAREGVLAELTNYLTICVSSGNNKRSPRPPPPAH